MKNKKAKKTYSSTKKQTSNAKIALTVLLVIVILCGAAIFGTLAAISDGFTKPVEEWFSDKAPTVTPGGDQGDQTGDDQGDQTGGDQGDQTGDETVCKHIFDHGVCVDCGDRVADVIPMATKVISPDEECTVNYWTQDYQLIKTEKALGGDYFVELEGYENYFFLSSNELTVNSYDGVENVSVLVNGEFFDISDYVGSSFCSFYPTFDNSLGKNAIKLLAGESFTVRYNGKLLGGHKSSSVNPIFPEFHDIFEFNARPYIFLNEGDELELLSFNYGGIYFSADGFCFNAFQSGYEISYGLDTVNVIVIGYEFS